MPKKKNRWEPGRKVIPQLTQVSSCVLLLVLQGPTAAPGEKGGVKVS